jgi:hypothetical protein
MIAVISAVSDGWHITLDALSEAYFAIAVFIAGTLALVLRQHDIAGGEFIALIDNIGGERAAQVLTRTISSTSPSCRHMSNRSSPNSPRARQHPWSLNLASVTPPRCGRSKHLYPSPSGIYKQLLISL